MSRYLFFVVLLFAVITAQGQTCIPDQNITTPGFFPKIIEPAYVDSNYKQVLQIRVFPDTTVIIGGNPVVATIDSINVLDITGLPSGFYYTCNPTNCSFIPDSTGCSTLEGKATKGQAGIYPIAIEIEVFGKIFGTINTAQKDTLRQFSLTVKDLSSITELVSSKGLLYPNPSSDGHVMINKFVENSIIQIECFNQLGQSVEHSIVNGTISLASNPNGLYTIVVHMKNGETLNQKVLIQQ